jgi:hypothetical protein
MRNLNIKLQHKDITLIGDKEIKLLQKYISNESEMPEGFFDFLNKYQGAKLLEFIFVDRNKTTWVLGFIMKFTEMLELTQEYFNENKQNYFIPFASDAGGWHFCLSFQKKDFGSVYIYRWSDYKPEDAYLKIANSFEEFIDGLQSENISG